MIEIPIKNKKKEVVGHVKISDEDNDLVSQYSWHFDRQKYAMGWVTFNGERQKMYMHHLIAGKPPKGLLTDHINRDPFDNRRENLRHVSPSTNSQNARKNKTGKLIGVYHTSPHRWTAQCKNITYGHFSSEEEAALRYDICAFLHFGEHALTNGLTTYEEAKKYRLEDLVHVRTKSPKMKPKEIQILTEFFTKDGSQILVDDEFLPLLSPLSFVKNEHGYATTRFEGKRVRVHRLLFKFQGIEIPDGQYIDHINGNRLDNRMSNLRINDPSGNNHNRRKKENGSSIFKGVFFFKRDSTWMAQITKDGQNHFIGYFETERQAAIAYNLKAIELYGSFANINIFEGDIQEDEDIVKSQLSSNKKRKGTSSKYRGVTFIKSKTKNWFAQIQKKGVHYTLGTFSTQEEAARAYNEKAIELYGENYKYLNVIE